MANTGERREIKARANAHETEVVRQSQKLVSKTKQFSAGKDAQGKARSAKAKQGRSRGNAA